ncbi:MAG: AAA family ATPase [Oscillospiraceae bacterium]
MNEKIKLITGSISQVIAGKESQIRKVLITLICGGHVLIEDVPGVGKTQLVSSLARSLDGKYNRIQMTPDIMPSDITGFSMFSSSSEKFIYRDGAVMCNFLLADEINRASPKAQSSLLEAMEEYQVTVDGDTKKLPEPFMVLATQNPVETYGTYHLPEAQMDRFFMRISMGYPTEEEEMLILERTENDNPVKRITKAVMNMNDILEIREEAKKIYVSEKIRKYIIGIVNNTRNNDAISLGISPRGSISLFKAAKAEAYINDRDYVIPDDVKYCAESVLAHRIILSPKGRNKYGTAEKAISAVLRAVEVPVE